MKKIILFQYWTCWKKFFAVHYKKVSDSGMKPNPNPLFSRQIVGPFLFILESTV